VARQYKNRLASLGDRKSTDIGNRMGNLFYLMHRNRCVLRDVVREVRAED
jgi:hypothetical protein